MEIVHRQPKGRDVRDDVSWADAEFRDADFGDARLNRRVVRIAKSLAAAPKESIPTASDGLAETLAVYRFFDNEKVTLEKVLKPHVHATHRRIRKHRWCWWLKTRRNWTTRAAEIATATPGR